MMAVAWRSKWLDWQPGNEIISTFLEPKLTKPTKPTSVSFVRAKSGEAQIISDPADDSAAWRAGFCGWMALACVVRDRCFGGIGSLYIQFCEWTIAHNAAPCTRETFEVLLTNAGYSLADGMVSGLILAEDWESGRLQAGTAQGRT